MTRPRPVRAEAGEPLDVTMTVNGTEVTLSLPARVTLADALRDHLGLTGTHLGCEHGVCGMCTVLVDGSAARACLLFACQLDGAEIVTVEGLGRPDDLHPLQEAFGAHHALQCGFCTPGFLLSSYDLLVSKPDVAEEDLPVELSGVLCRCTGYRNILSAVSEVAHAHRDGIPAPRNCGQHVLLGHTAAKPGAKTAPETAGAREIELPQGDPTFTVEVTQELAASPEKTWRVLDDIDLVAACLPGAEITEHLGDDRYRGRARVAVGPIRLSFAGLAQVSERDAAAHRLRVIGQGEDAGGGRTQADILLLAEETPAGTRLRATAQVYLTGRIAQFGRALAGDVSRRMFEQFAAAVEETAVSGVRTAAAKPPGALALLGATLVAKAREWGRRLRRAEHSPRN
ncbi:2Fe-2S iron-sulfur cluster-binding protein [Amycolatopsis sp. FDAARGOS 1241]|uniref:xanthine dehydrogenase family Fe-S subunit n=1 Tax=Amycolatopsis sp. FDAARGOS 1241 TaxID=2778070 RepID=UPI001950A1C7|nr:2Fe-2S iron-sulfur cluster-binding protein [Amycolatopsis sp. FDAARGOS 1241]QRP49585.1 2Fe-2S iron-sulfur cluster binding domain-containing protein [Amycolatopsis sp. FDAARGOS 1241]